MRLDPDKWFILDFQIMPPRRTRSMARRIEEEEVESLARSLNETESQSIGGQPEVPQPAPAPANSELGDLLQAILNYLQKQQQPQPPAPQSYLKQFLKLTPSPFKGERDPDIGESWLNEIEKRFEVMECPDREKTRLAAYMLQGQAEIWWRSLLRTTFEGYVNISWKEFLDAFQDKYFPMHIRDAKEIEFMELKQDSRTVMDYEDKFSALGRYAPHIYGDERRRVMKFIRGLRGSIRRYVVVQDPTTFATALRLAHLAEQENNQFKEERRKTVKRPASPTGEKEEQKINQDPTPTQDRPFCNKCGRKHGGVECWRSLGKCLSCGQDGHQIAQCPKRNKEIPQKKIRTEGRVYSLVQKDSEDDSGI
jgi:hypothetical protein